MELNADACYRALRTRDARFDGRLFVGVKTTGIYCRPICPARTPKRENVLFFPTAAAAQEAGFRPCLRCRPGDGARPRGVARHVEHGVARAGAHRDGRARRRRRRDAGVDGSASASGSCAGSSAQHLGASPIAVAQTRRVLLAKQLIHETTPADERGRARRRLRQHPPLQRDVSAAVQPTAGRAAADRSAPALALERRGHDAAALPAAVRLAGDARVPDGARDPGVEVVADDTLRAHHRDRRRARHRARFAGARATRCRVTVRFPKLSALPTIIARLAARVRSVGRSASRSARSCRRIRRWRRSSRPGPGCACRAPGTASSSRCAPCSASRSR